MTTPEPADLRHVAAADVYLGDTAVATLTRAAGDDIVFQYTTTAPPPGAPIRASSVSWSLPADARTPLVTSGGPAVADRGDPAQVRAAVAGHDVLYNLAPATLHHSEVPFLLLPSCRPDRRTSSGVQANRPRLAASLALNEQMISASRSTMALQDCQDRRARPGW